MSTEHEHEFDDDVCVECRERRDATGVIAVDPHEPTVLVVPATVVADVMQDE